MTQVSLFRWGNRVALRYSPRALVVTVLVLLAAAVVLVLHVGTGEYPMSPLDVLRTFTGNGNRGTEYIIYDLRLPRALTALLTGLALGMSGAVFQSMTRNALGSPDVIGFTQGAALGAVLVILFLHGGQPQVAAGAVAGGLGVSALVYLLSYRKGVQGYRLILVGIGVTAVLTSLVWYLLLQAKIDQAQNAFVWLTGSLNGRDWSHVIPVAVALVLLVPPTLAMGGRMRMLEMGDHTAHALGVDVERSRLALLFLGTALCAVAVSSIGPVSYVALAAPQIAKRLAGTATVGLVPAGAVGALLLVGSDLAAQRLFAPVQLPVGVATLAVGGIYLAWLLFRENKVGRG